MNDDGNRAQMEQTGADQGVGSPISNRAYNVIRALASKLEGLEAFRKYARDGDSSVWADLTRADVRSVDVLLQQLEQVIQDGELRMKEPGLANA